MNLIQQLEAEAIADFKAKKDIPDFRAGDTVRVGVRVVKATAPASRLTKACDRALEPWPWLELHRAQDLVRRRRGARVPALLAQHRSITVVRRGVVRRAKLYYLVAAPANRRVLPSARSSRPARRAESPTPKTRKLCRKASWHHRQGAFCCLRAVPPVLPIRRPFPERFVTLPCFASVTSLPPRRSAPFCPRVGSRRRTAGDRHRARRARAHAGARLRQPLAQRAGAARVKLSRWRVPHAAAQPRRRSRTL
jgi:large subunit ribosomal protein L19